MTKPLVSVVLPTFNRAPLLDSAIKKCLDQTYANIELLIVDDGSTDNTKETVLSWSNKDRRVRYLLKEHSGVPRSLNYGFEHANGEWLTWTSDDNEYYPNAIEELVNCALSFGKPCLVYSDIVKTYADGQTKTISFPLTEPLPALLRRTNPIGNCFLYHRSVTEAVGGYDRDYFMAEDYEYWVRVSRQFPIVHLGKILYYCSYYAPSLTNSRRFEVRAIASLIRMRHGLISESQCIDEIKTHLQNLLLSEAPARNKAASFVKIIYRTVWLFLSKRRYNYTCYSDTLAIS